MPTHPFADTLQTALRPYVRLAQSNLALFTDFWLAPEMLANTFVNPQRLYSPGTSSATEPSSDPFTRFGRGLLENYSRFFGELLQVGTTLWSAAPYRFPGGAAADGVATAAARRTTPPPVPATA